MGYADGEEFESLGVCKSGGGGVLFVLWIVDWVVFGLLVLEMKKSVEESERCK